MKDIFVFIFLFCLFKFSASSCPDGTLPSLNNPLLCYEFDSNPTVFTEAEMECQNRGGHLAAVTDGFTNAFLAQNANRTFTTGPDFWVGGEDLDQKGTWVWTDGAAFAFQNWAPNEPDLLPGFQCISITKDRSFWFTTDCFDEKPYICELPALISPTTTKTSILTTTLLPVEATTTYPSILSTTEEIIETTTTLGPPIYTCDGGWTQYNETHFCFKVFTKNVFDDAEVACKSFGGHLASIHSTEELALIDTLLDNSYYWLGLCTSDNGITWAWTDGTTTTDFVDNAWCSSGPDHSANTCAVLTPQNNCLTNVHKTMRTYGLCKKFANVSYGTV